MSETLCNLRDVGGLPLVGGGTVCSGVLYRGDAPVIDDEPPTALPWPPATVVDLRSPDEIANLRPATPWPGHVHVVQAPLMAEADPTRGRDVDEMSVADQCAMNLSMLENAGSLITIATTIASAELPVFVHCAGGMGRTAVVVALALEVAGVETDAILSDQQRSNTVLPELGRRFARALGRPEPVPVPPVAPEALIVVLERWRSHPDGVRGWLTSIGLPAGHYDQLRHRLR